MGRRKKASIEETVGKRLQEARDRQGLSQAALARKAGVSQSNIARIEEGNRSPTIGTLTKLAKGLGLGLGELVQLAPVKTNPAKAEQVFYRLCDRLRDRDEEFLRGVERLIDALEAVE